MTNKKILTKLGVGPRIFFIQIWLDIAKYEYESQWNTNTTKFDDL